MGDIQAKTVEELSQYVSRSTAIWLKEISIGICYEEVKDRLKPTSLGAVKTFKKV